LRYRQALLLVALAAAPAIHAETLYVIEQLVVNVNSTPDNSGVRVATIKSGEAVEVLDRQGDEVHVHLPNGTEGWVRKSYLSADEPLQHRLTQRTAEVEQLKQDVARLEGELAAARTGRGGTKVPSAPATKAPPATAPVPTTTPTSGPGGRTGPSGTSGSNGTSAPGGTSTSTSETNTVDTPGDPAPGEPAYFMTPPESPARPVWHWALGSFVVALGLGYALGWFVLDRRIRRKYGGLRIY
jgi:hypothetical protein